VPLSPSLPGDLVDKLNSPICGGVDTERAMSRKKVKLALVIIRIEDRELTCFINAVLSWVQGM
jgi:hypothetical protein